MVPNVPSQHVCSVHTCAKVPCQGTVLLCQGIVYH